MTCASTTPNHHDKNCAPPQRKTLIPTNEGKPGAGLIPDHMKTKTESC
eukprot:CAMPEP_0204331234 /NCGR_PEP_ID=MMETSP0469-20131031/15554_1 /ASSEMBLY_ACC=CAM_ASM_000384 /TAXON_ID=2969 /ORGANISM="Oxyrrhis marina" /LENGTH=47 /DNA_ID= /DNA_START= /DNA_END= /DNA_ORIENTATION=